MIPGSLSGCGPELGSRVAEGVFPAACSSERELVAQYAGALGAPGQDPGELDGVERLRCGVRTRGMVAAGARAMSMRCIHTSQVKPMSNR